MCVLFFFFFKQKTAYEMRISDWSSDVCSSDLGRDPGQIGLLHRLAAEQADRTGAEALLGESEVGERRMIAERHAGKAQGADVDLLVQPAISGGNGGAEPARTSKHLDQPPAFGLSLAALLLEFLRMPFAHDPQRHAVAPGSGKAWGR